MEIGKTICGGFMAYSQLIETFTAMAQRVGAEVHFPDSIEEAVICIAEQTIGTILIPPCHSFDRLGLAKRLTSCGLECLEPVDRNRAHTSAAGLTGANFAIAATGTVVLESTLEPVRLASTLPEKHFVLLDPRKILVDSAAAVPLLRQLHARLPQAYLAYITGPSRTADIERVLTIGVHGPKQLHILLLEGISESFLES